MALINPKTGSSKFKAIVRREAIISLATETPSILSESDDFSIKLLEDAVSGEAISHKELQEVPNEEIDANGIWIHAHAAKLQDLSQEELIALVLKMKEQTGAEIPLDAIIGEETVPVKEVAEEAAEEPAEDKPKKKKKKKTSTEDDESLKDVSTPAETSEEPIEIEF